jgi:hypothetical protein
MRGVSAASRLQQQNDTAARFMEAEMRKEDRIRQQREQSEQQPPPPSTPPKNQEKMRGSAEADQPAKPPRQSGKLPLPD